MPAKIITQFIFLCLSLVGFLFPLQACATSYAVTTTTYSWIDASSHTKLGPTTGGIYSSQYSFTNGAGCNTKLPSIDDSITNSIPIGFTFTFGTTGFTSVNIMSNGRIQFNNNTTCGAGSPVTQIPYPDNSLTYTMRVYGNDLDASLKSEVNSYDTPCTSRSSCYISYSTIGTTPNRSFVVTFNNVPEWTSLTSAAGSYNLQMILKENGEFIYQYGTDIPGPQAPLGQIGWEISTSDYAIAAVGYPTNNSAFLFYIPTAGATTPGSFNAFDTNTAAGALSGYIQTKIAATTFNLDVVALNAAGTSILTGFTGGIAVELVDASGSGGCSNYPAIGSTISLNYAAANAGRKTVAFTESNAWKNVRLRIKYPIFSPTVISCSTDNFAIRPDHFVASATDTNWTTAGASRTLNASTASGSPTHKAGQAFTLSTSAYNSGSAITTGYSGTPDSISTSCVIPASGCVAGTLSGGTFSNSSGIATSVTANYSEVGVISTTLADTSFANVDANDGTSLVNRTIAASPITIGRFVPDHFDATLNTPVFAPACSSFTYIGQPIKYASNPQVTITAKNAAGNTTKNYTSSLWKISPADATYGITPSYTEASQPLTVLNSNAATASDSGNGIGTLSFADTSSNILNITRSAPLTAFNTEIAMSFMLWDTDGVTVGNINGVTGSNPVKFATASSGNGISFTGNNKTQRWGRLNMANANGSELTALTVPLFSEYYNGTSFVKNNYDNCTTLSLTNQLSLNNPNTANGAAQAGNIAMTIASGSSQATLAHTPLLAGDAGLSFSSPGSGNTGYININGNFSSLPWLLFDWNNDGLYDNSPAAKASFGLYQGNPKLIFFREMY